MNIENTGNFKFFSFLAASHSGIATLKAHKDALPHLATVSLWPLEEFRDWAKAALACIRELRTKFVGVGDLSWRAMALEKLGEYEIDAPSLALKLKAKLANKDLKMAS